MISLALPLSPRIIVHSSVFNLSYGELPGDTLGREGDYHEIIVTGVEGQLQRTVGGSLPNNLNVLEIGIGRGTTLCRSLNRRR